MGTTIAICATVLLSLVIIGAWASVLYDKKIDAESNNWRAMLKGMREGEDDGLSC